MEREEDLWLRGDASRFDLDEEDAPVVSWLLINIDAKDLIWSWVIFGLEIAFLHLNHAIDTYFDLGDPKRGLLFAFISVGISFLVSRLGGYKRF